MNANERFEIIGDLFNRATGYLRPGKSVPMAMNYDSSSEENHKRFDQWFATQSFNDALNRIYNLERKVELQEREIEDLKEPRP